MTTCTNSYHDRLRTAEASLVRLRCYRLGAQGRDLVLFNCALCHTTIARSLAEDPWRAAALAS